MGSLLRIKRSELSGKVEAPNRNDAIEYYNKINK